MLVHGQVCEELLDFRFAHVPRVALVVEEDEALRPLDVGPLGAAAEMAHPDGGAYLVEQPRWPIERADADQSDHSA